jgi:hypothetical protein
MNISDPELRRRLDHKPHLQTVAVKHLRAGSVKVVRSNIYLADLQIANDICLYRDDIFLILKLTLD